ncbi:MAG: FliG C-terminal domain-containing protein [Pseudomonadota bacterium]
MTDIVEFAGQGNVPANVGDARTPLTPARTAAGGADLIELNQAQKAAVIIGILGPDAAGPVLENMDEENLRSFAAAMSRIKRIPPDVVIETIQEFLIELAQFEMTVSGGLKHARSVLQDYIPEATLTRILDDIDTPSAHNVWKKLTTVEDQALAEFLAREHPQTAAVVLSKLSAEHAAEILGRLSPERAREIVVGLKRTTSMDSNIVEAIGESVSNDFLEHYRGGGTSVKPEERIGMIMNYTSGEIRQSVLDFLGEKQPEFLEAVKARMFTFADIQDRIEKRDITAIVRATAPEDLLKAMIGAQDTAPQTFEFIINSLSSRVAEQLREEMADAGKVKVREAEEAQNAMLKVIRAMEAAGELALIAVDE